MKQKRQLTEDEIIKSLQKKKILPIFYYVIAILLLIALAVSVVVFKPFSGDENNVIVTEDPEISVAPHTLTEEDLNFLEDQQWLEENPYPIVLKDWQTEEHNSSNSSEADEYFINSMNDNSSNIGSISTSILPSENAGYTSDLNKQTINGAYNPLFSYWTSEIFNKEVGNYLERLLNPIYGGWYMFQYPSTNAGEYFQVSLISDMFTNEYLESHSSQPYSEWVPVYADWNSNDYGMSDVLLQSDGRWFGTINNSEVSFIYNESISQYEVDLVSHITFTAWNTDQGKEIKNGILTLHLVSNPDLSDSPRVLISDASLEVS